ncbi:MAG: hypothetical protein EBV24_02510, partial [Actinobacteria bacterium]|nr:hypothetical protein [Actinomycetota bacterium]
TRKLILTALVCGLAILIAGGVKLIQVANDEVAVEVLAFGDEATLGDMTVSVLDIERRPDATLVTVTMTGVDLTSGAADGWRLLADGRVQEPASENGRVQEPASVSDTDGCTAVRAGAPTRCTVRFDAVESAATVAYVRAGEQRQWAATTP